MTAAPLSKTSNLRFAIPAVASFDASQSRTFRRESRSASRHSENDPRANLRFSLAGQMHSYEGAFDLWQGEGWVLAVDSSGSISSGYEGGRSNPALPIDVRCPPVTRRRFVVHSASVQPVGPSSSPAGSSIAQIYQHNSHPLPVSAETYENPAR